MAKKTCAKSCHQCLSLLGDKTRLHLFSKIRSGTNQVKLLEKEVSVSQPTISHHLKMLTDYGVVKSAKKGRETKYTYHKKFACQGCNVFNSEFRITNPKS